MANLPISDFSGGITENHIGGDPTKYQKGANLVIGSDKKVSSRPGSGILDATYFKLPNGGIPARIDTISRFVNQNIYQARNKLYFAKAGVGWTEIQGPAANSAFSTSTVTFDQCSSTVWNNHLLITSDRRERPKFIYQSGSDFLMRTIGLPVFDPSTVAFSAAGANSREYGFCYAYSYTISGVTYEMRGPVRYLPYTGALPNSLTGLPVLTNGANDHYDTANIKIEIYRTADTTAVHYKVGEVTNGTTTFTDSVADVDLSTHLLLYSDANDLDYDQPPECKYIIQLNGIAYYLNIKDRAGSIFPNRLVQAAADQIYAANEGNTVDVDGELTAGAVAGQNVLVFTEDKTYRLEGVFDSAGGGNIQKVEVSRIVGCISHKSIVQTHEGAFFAAKDGFYFTDGYSVVRISEDFNDAYSALAATTTRKRIYGAADAVKKRIYWALSSTSTAPDNDSMYVAHCYWGIQAKTPFTTWDGGVWPTNFQPTALAFYDNMLVSGEKNGYLLKYVEGTLNDAKIDTAVAPSSWNVYPIIYDYKSVAFDFGDVTNRKWVTKISVYADSIARATLALFSNNDNTGVLNPLAEIKANSPVLFYDPILFGDSSVRFDFSPIINGIRRFPSPFRVSYKQIQIRPSYTLIDSSIASGTVSVDGVAKTVTLNTVSYKWDTYAVDYFLSFDTDSYAKEFRVSARTSDLVLTVADLENFLQTMPAASFKLRGYRKNEALKLLSYSIHYETMTPTQTPYRAA